MRSYLVFLLRKGLITWQCDLWYTWLWLTRKVKSDRHILCLEFNRNVCVSFRGNRAIFGWVIANSIFDLENSRWRSGPRSNPTVTFGASCSIGMFAFCSVAVGPFLAEIKQIPYLTLKIQDQSHDKNRQKSNQVIYRSGSLILPKMKEIRKVVQKLSREQKSATTSSAASDCKFVTVTTFSSRCLRGLIYHAYIPSYATLWLKNKSLYQLYDVL